MQAPSAGWGCSWCESRGENLGLSYVYEYLLPGSHDDVRERMDSYLAFLTAVTTEA